jgi:hypothetical protein
MKFSTVLFGLVALAVSTSALAPNAAYIRYLVTDSEAPGEVTADAVDAAEKV